MFFPTLACPACSLTPPPWNLQFVNPDHVYIAWAIVIAAIFAFFLPFLKGYRLGGHVPYSLLRHLILTLVLELLPLGFFFLSPYPISFGGALLELFYLPFYLLSNIFFLILPARLPETFGVMAALLAYTLYCVIAAWIMLKVDRWLYKKQATVDPGIK